MAGKAYTHAAATYAKTNMSQCAVGVGHQNRFPCHPSAPPAVCLAAHQQGLTTFDGGVAGLKTTVNATWSFSAQILIDPCSDGKNYSLPEGTFTMAQQVTGVDTTQTRTRPTVQFGCEAGKNYTVVMRDAGPMPVEPGNMGFLHWARINIPGQTNGSCILEASTSTLGEDYSPTVGVYMNPANFQPAPHNYGIFVFEQALHIAPTAEQIKSLSLLNGNSSFRLADFLTTHATEITNQNAVARTWANIQAGIWSPHQFALWKMPAYIRGSCNALDANEAYNAAIAQGVAYKVFGTGDTKYLNRKVMAVFKSPALDIPDPCGDGVNQSLPAVNFTMAQQTSGVDTALTRTEPTVSWPCEANKNYTMVMYDAGSLPVVSTPAPKGMAYGNWLTGGGPSGGANMGYLHWLRVNIPCGSQDGTADSTGGEQFSAALGGFVTPMNPQAVAHQYEISIFEQTGGTINATTEEVSYFQALNNKLGFSMPLFLATYATQIPGGKAVGRTWAQLKDSYFSVHVMPTAPWKTHGCRSISVKPVVEAAVSQQLADKVLPENHFGGDLKFLSREVTATFSAPATTLVDPCDEGNGKSYALPASNFSMALQITDTRMTRVAPTVTWPCDNGTMYTLFLIDVGTSLPVQETPGPHSAYLHWARINVPCSSNGVATVTGGSGGADFSPGTAFLPPVNFQPEPHNYGFWVFEQSSSIVPTPNEQATFVRSGFVLSQWLNTYWAQIPAQTPIGRTWANVIGSVFSASMFKSMNMTAYQSTTCKNMCLVKSAGCRPLTITQTATLTGAPTAADQSTAIQDLARKAHGVVLGLYRATDRTWIENCAVTSSLKDPSVTPIPQANVTFVASVSAEMSSAAASAANLLSPIDLNAALAAVKLGDPDTYASVPDTVVFQSVGKPIFSYPSSSSDDDDDNMMIIWIIVGVVVVVAIALAAIYIRRNRGPQRAEAVTIHKESIDAVQIDNVETGGSTPLDDKTIRI